MIGNRRDGSRGIRQSRWMRLAAVVSLVLAISSVPSLAAAWSAANDAENVPGGGAFSKHPAFAN